MLENLNALRLLFYRPSAAMSDLLDHGRMGSAAVLALIASAILLAGIRPALSGLALRYAYYEAYAQMAPEGAAPPAAPPLEQFLAGIYSETSFYTPVLIIAVLVVPLLAMGGSLFDRLGSFTVLLQRDYGALFTCSLMAWVAASLPAGLVLLVSSRVTSPALVAAVSGAALLLFGLLTSKAVQVVFGSEVPQAILITALGLAGFAGGLWLTRNSGFNLGFLLSPFLLYLLFMAYQQSGSDLFQLGAGMRSRQSFKRHLEACTINPADSDAQYQLGLIYQQRRQLDEAVARFQRAVEINPSETDAHFQLGRIARQQGRMPDALRSFQTVVDQDQKHSSYEVWREVGALHLAAGRANVALEELRMYTEKREFDPEGLFYLGQAYEQLGDKGKAAAAYRSAIESVKTAPSFRRGPLHRWSRQSQRALKKLGA
jgi:tetratricopeptide (TPR) repeat protein